LGEAAKGALGGDSTGVLNNNASRLGERFIYTLHLAYNPGQKGGYS